MVVSLTLSLFTIWSVTPAFAACTVNGQVYRDFNASGTQDALEPGVAGITVTAFDASGVVIGTATTIDDPNPALDGTYSLIITAPDGEVRVEFTGLPTFLRSGPAGGQSATTVTFVDCSGGATMNGIDLALANPGQYCHTTNPTLVSSCYVYGDQTTGRDAVIDFPYDSGTTLQSGTSAQATTPHGTLALDSDVGAVWGAAYHRGSDSVFLAALTKRHVGYAPGGGSGVIYSVDRFSGVVTPLIDLGAAAGLDPHDTTCAPAPCDPFFQDLGAWDAVGKTAFGDIDLSDDDQTLYAINLFDRNLYQIAINPDGTAGASSSRRIPSPTSVICPGGGTFIDQNPNLRPGALRFSDGNLYVGLTCAGPTVSDLHAYVYSFNPTTGAFTEEVNFALDYPRGYASRAGAACSYPVPSPLPAGCAPAAWQPWANSPAALLPGPFGQVYYPQPWLLDIEFDEQGFMILGLIDRAGHQVGNDNTINPQVGPVEGVVAGDLLRLRPTGATWTLESNGSDGVNTTGGAGNNQGPGGGEFYFHDRFRLLSSTTHDEITLSGLFVLPGRGEVMSGAFDPAPNGNVRAGGFVWLSNSTGQRTRSFEIFGVDFPRTFGKAAGVGDIEGICGPAPLEIGNRVWEDLDGNGRQDPGETPFGGVILTLYIDFDGDGIPELPVATTTTNANGEYIFNEATILASIGGLGAAVPNVHYLDINGDGFRQANEPFGILPFSNYEIRIEDPTNFTGPLANYFATAADAQANTRDSDGQVTNPGAFASAANFPSIRLTTGNFGDNDHTFDFGFSQVPPVLPTATPLVPPAGTPGPSGTPVAQALLTNLIITKQVDPPFALPGNTVTWTISVTNPNAVAVSNVIVEDNFAPELEILSWSSAVGAIAVNGQFWTFTLPSLGAGETATATVVTRIRPNVPLPFIVDNVAAVQGVQVPPSASNSNVSPGTGGARLPAAGFGVSGFGRGVGYARASLVSVNRLPSTGESSLPLLAIAGGVVVAIGALLILRKRTVK
jgi:uncharacterized repeat protein (TIGR01451 family)/LPXTG-motif cell wall-anchored protein